MDIVIKNCNSIDEAKINITPNTLNIKYGANGTGNELNISLSMSADVYHSKILRAHQQIIDFSEKI